MEWGLKSLTPDEWIDCAVKAKFRVSGLTKLCSVSERSLELHFAREFRAPPKYWLRKLRTLLAAQRIGRRECLKRVASDLNYSTPSHLITEFNVFFGCSPKEYRIAEASRSKRRKLNWPTEWQLMESEFQSATLHPKFRLKLFPTFQSAGASRNSGSNARSVRNELIR